VLRVAVLGANKFAIPLAKLADLGVPTPVTDAKGRFEIAGLPEGAEVALKVAHPQYAQEGTAPVRAGTDTTVTLTPGALLRGQALRRDDGAPAAGAQVTFRSAHPPHDTTLVVADAQGEFLARLKPGHYLYRAASDTLASAGWEQFTANVAEARLQVYLGPLGRLEGEVRDAESGEPVAGARVVVQTERSVEAYLRSGADGRFALDAAEGDYVVALTGAPGYFPPAAGGMRVRLAAGETLNLPGQWLAPIAPFRVQFVNAEGAGMPGVLVSLLRPAQFGWTLADAAGWATLHVGALPEDGRILGIAEDPHQPLGALFTLTRESGQEARVQMLALGAVQGTVRNARGRALAGATVAAYFPGEEADEVPPLWRTVTDAEGDFAWSAVIPGVPLRILVEHGDTAAQGDTFSLNAGENRVLAPIQLDTTARGKGMDMARMPWAGHRLLCGPGTPELRVPAWILYAAPAEVPAAQAAASAARSVFGETLEAVVVVEGSHGCEGGTVPIYAGRRPGAGNSYLVQATGRVSLMGFGLPPAHALRGLLDAKQ
jgi:hypothetical protein